MNKKDFLSLMFCDLVAVILLIEHYCKLDLAIWCLGGWTIASLLIHINILWKYIKPVITFEEDCYNESLDFV
jgi:hypothetical protein